MDCIKQPSSESTRSKISNTFSKCIHPQTPSRYPPPNPKLKTLSEELNISLKDFNKPEPKITRTKSQRSYSTDHHHPQHQQQQAFKNRAVKEALLSKLFASLSAIKAAYAELQSAQFPYNNDAIQSADESLVSELTVLSELKQKYYNKCLNLPPPHVTQLLAEIQEQQSNIKTYEITMKQMEWKMDQKDSEIESLKKEINQVNITNKNLEKRLNSSGVLFPLGNSISIDELNQCQFFRVLHFSIRSLRHFVKQLVREMEAKEWDIDLAVKAVEPNTVFGKPKHKIFALESYVSQVMFDGFNHHNFFLPDEGTNTNTNAKQPLKNVFFQNFQKLQSLTPSQIFSQNPRNPFAKFCRAKYLKLMHPKMECSFFGNLDQRKVISSGAFPSTEFFSLFAEMARRIWLLHCLAFSFDPPAVAFQVRRNCRFSEVYMESVSPEDDFISSDVTASFTVIPGFKIGKTVVQSVVYLSPAKKR